MISSNTRATRSQYSSPGPAAAAAATAAQSGGPLEANKSTADDASRAFMRRWMEPTVQQKPSFEEVGLGRYGVLENMQPLGSLPKGTSAAARKSLPAGASNGLTRKIILRASGAGGGSKNSAESSEVHGESSSHPLASESRVRQGSSSSRKPSPIINTPSPPPSSVSSPPISPSQRSTQLRPRPSQHSSTLPPRKSTSSKTSLRDTIEKDSILPDLAPPPSEVPSRRSLMTRGDLDDDYQPKAGTMRTSKTRSPVARRSLARPSAGRQSLSAGADASRASVAGSDDVGGDAAKRRTAVGRVVADAVESALKYHRYPTAYALRTVYDENSENPQVVAMFEDVFLQRADAETIDQFAALISETKRMGARDDVAYRHWGLTGVPEKPITAPYADLIKLDLGEVIASGHGGDKRAQKKHKTTHSDSPSLLHSRRSEARTGGGCSATEVAAPSTPPRKRGRRDSSGSDSSLSSTVSFDTPNFNGTSGLSIVAKATDAGDGRPKPPARIKIKAHPAPPSSPQAAGGGGENKRERQARNTRKAAAGKVGKVGSKGKVGTRGPSVDADAVTVGGVAGGEDDVSGAPAVTSQPIARRGKAAVTGQQRKSAAAAAAVVPAATSSSDTSSSTNPARPEVDGPPKNKDKIRDTLSPSRSISPSTQTHQHHQHHDSSSHYGAGPDEIAAGREHRDMPGLVAPLFPNLPVKTSRLRSVLQPDAPDGDPKKKRKRPSRGASAAAAAAAKAEDDGPATTTTAAASSARPRSVARASEGRDTPAPGRRTTRNAGRSGAVSTPPPSGVSTRSTRSAVKRARDEMDGTASPTPSVRRSRAPSETASRASRTSRASTPVLPPPSKKQRVGPRIKKSPKKSGNTAAGIPRLSGEGLSSHMPGAVANRDQIENDDFCSACGGSGDLICCDCCTKSFHLECVDLIGAADLPDNWYCQECHYKLSADKKVHRGPFGPLLNLLEKSIPRAFSLPKKVQTYFEDVKAGANGEYEEIDRTKASRKDKNQEFDFFQQRDADGNAVLCHGCQKAAGPDKLIMPCSACPLYWHLDCLETPAAHPPNPKKWVCPAHVDPFFDESGSLGRRFRRTRGAQVITPLYTRGNRNNGVIEVDYSDAEGETEGDASGWKDVRTYGRVVRLPAKGIKLDFIEQLRKIGAGRISRGRLRSEDDDRGARYAPLWDVAKAEAAVTLCRLRDTPPMAQRTGTASDTAVTAASVDGINGDKAKQEPAEEPHAVMLLAQVQAGQVSPDSLSATDKQSLRQMMETIKMALGDEPQESSVNDGIYDGASTTPEASEEAVTPKADTPDKGTDTSLEDEVIGDDTAAKSTMGNGIEVVGEGEGDDEVGPVVPKEEVAEEGEVKVE